MDAAAALKPIKYVGLAAQREEPQPVDSQRTPHSSGSNARPILVERVVANEFGAREESSDTLSVHTVERGNT